MWVQSKFTGDWVRKAAIVGVYVWEMRERNKACGYQVLADTHSRMIVMARCNTKEGAEAEQRAIVEGACWFSVRWSAGRAIYKACLWWQKRGAA